MNPTYAVTATRSQRWWALEACDVRGRSVHAQCRRLDQAEATIREAIDLVVDDDVHTFAVEIRPGVPDGLISDQARDVIAGRRGFRAIEEATPAVVRELRCAGFTVRDVGELLGLTGARISQIDRLTRAD